MYAAKHLNLAALHGSKLSISMYILIEPRDHVFSEITHHIMLHIQMRSKIARSFCIYLLYEKCNYLWKDYSLFCYQNISASAYRNRSLVVFENINYKIIVHFDSYSSFSTNLFLLSFQTSWWHKTWLEL